MTEEALALKGPGRSPLRKANAVDAHVGARLKLRRTIVGISQEELAARIGVTFQQVQKYENGANRVSASRLHQVAGILQVPVAWFFADLVKADAPAELDGEQPANDVRDEARDAEAAELDRDTLELVKLFGRIGDVKMRKHLLRIAETLATEIEAKAA